MPTHNAYVWDGSQWRTLSSGVTNTSTLATTAALNAYRPAQNILINGNMELIQRYSSAPTTGFSSPTGTGNYIVLDRWVTYRSGWAAGHTTSRQSTGGLAYLPYCMRVQRNSGNTSTAGIFTGQNVESAVSAPYAGQTVTLSFYARAGANFSSSNFTAYIWSGTGTDQSQVASITGGVVTGASFALGTQWQRFSCTAAVPSNSNQLFVQFASYPTGTAGANDYYDITGVQLEPGSVASTFQVEPVADNLRRCQRYYYRATGAAAYGSFGATAVAYNTTTAEIHVPLPVAMRVAPTSTATANTGLTDYAGRPIIAISSISIGSTSVTTLMGCANLTVASGLTAGVHYIMLCNNNAAGYLDFSAEM